MKNIFFFSLAIDKQTTTQNNIIQAGNQLVDFKTKDQSAVTYSIIDKKPVNAGIWVIIICIGILVISLIYFFRVGRKAI